MTMIRKNKTLKVADRLESVRSAAERLGISRDSVINLIGRGELRATDMKPIMVNSSDVDNRIRAMFREAGIVEL